MRHKIAETEKMSFIGYISLHSVSFCIHTILSICTSIYTTILTAWHKTDPSDWSSNRLVPPVGETRKSSFKAFGILTDTRTRVSPGKHATVKLLQCALAFYFHSQRFQVEMSGHTVLHGLILLYSIHPLVLAEKPGKWTKTRQMIGNKRVCLLRRRRLLVEDFELFTCNLLLWLYIIVSTRTAAPGEL